MLTTATTRPSVTLANLRLDLPLFEAGEFIDPVSGQTIFRDPETWLAPRTLQRCIGLPVTSGAPDAVTPLCASMLGAVLGCYVEGLTVRAVIRITDHQFTKQIGNPDTWWYGTDLSYIAGKFSENTDENGQRRLAEELPVHFNFLNLTIEPKE